MKSKHYSILKLIPVLLLLPSLLLANERPLEETTEIDIYSYYFGYGIGKNIVRDDIELDFTSFAKAIQDALDKKPLYLTKEQIEPVLETKQQEFQEIQKAKRQKQAEENLKASDTFFSRNKKRKGINQTQSGLQYQIITQGNGSSPSSDTEVTVHYRGFLLNGEEFDNSYSKQRPSTFTVNSVIAGWSEGLQLMTKGAKYRLFVPADLAYGLAEYGENIEPNSALIIEVELLDFNNAGDDSKHHHHHDLIELAHLSKVPTIDLKVDRDRMSGWNLFLDTTGFEFTPQNLDTRNAEQLEGAEGHAHLYIDNEKIARLYSPWFHITGLAPGKHTIKVSLNSNRHESFAINGKVIEASVEITE